MKTETIEKILNFLKEKEGKEIPSKWFISIIKFIEKLENHPDGIQYRREGYLDLGYTNIKKLPNDLYVDDYLNLVHCNQLTELPDKLYVGGGLSLSNTNITKLPDNLYVGRYFDLQKTNIEEIPNNLYVGNDLYVYNTPLAKKYTEKEIREMITSKGGTLVGQIIR